MTRQWLDHEGSPEWLTGIETLPGSQKHPCTGFDEQVVLCFGDVDAQTVMVAARNEAIVHAWNCKERRAKQSKRLKRAMAEQCPTIKALQTERQRASNVSTWACPVRRAAMSKLKKDWWTARRAKV